GATRHPSELEEGQAWRWKPARRSGSCRVPVTSQRRGARREPLECRDLLVQNALYTGDLAQVQQHFPEQAEVNLVIQARSHDLRWTSQKWDPLDVSQGRRCLRIEQLQLDTRTVELLQKGFGEQHKSSPPHTTATLVVPMDPILTQKAKGAAQEFWRALLAGDGCAILCLLGDPESGIGPNSVFDTSDLDEWKKYRTNFRWLRLWSLTYQQELTTPLHITASRGYLDCLRHLLLRGADVDLAPGGETALHTACAAATADCVRLLLSFGANPEAVSEDGYQPLHMCRAPGSIECARLLLSHGANVNCTSEEEEETPLHVAARLGLAALVRLLLRSGADLEAKNVAGQTPLNAACAQPHATDDFYDVCLQLVEAGARVNSADEDRQRPLHQACKNANARVVALLLARGANVNIMSYSGNTALHNILQVAAYKLEHQPEVVVRDLLNHGAVRIWPGALLKVGG
ncbi:hypothetical protein lerEdw1_020411, partial [Lerista edwardsae]